MGAAVTAKDPDPNEDALVYTLEGADAARFAIDRATGQIEVGAGTKLDYETKDTYMVTVRVTDSFGDSDTIAVTITVTDMDEAPKVTGDATADYPENGDGPVATYTAVDPEGTAVKWSLSGVDAGDFSMDGGVLAFKKSPDFEKAKGGGSGDADVSNTYSVTVEATDSTRKTAMKTVTVTVTNVDEAGTVKLTTLRPRAGVMLTASVTDPDSRVSGVATDSGVTGPTWQWSRSRSGTSGWGNIDKATGMTYSPDDGDAGYYLRATATYKDKESHLDDKTAQVISANTVQAARSANDAPEFDDDQDPVLDGDQADATRKVTENTPAGEAIGDPVVATDDDDDILTYTLEGDECRPLRHRLGHGPAEDEG